MITADEREGLDSVFTQSMPAKGQPMGDTRDNWKYLAELYANSLVDMRAQISRLKQKINKLEQRK